MWAFGHPLNDTKRVISTKKVSAGKPVPTLTPYTSAQPGQGPHSHLIL